jgi:hypothetical protein
MGLVEYQHPVVTARGSALPHFSAKNIFSEHGPASLQIQSQNCSFSSRLHASKRPIISGLEVNLESQLTHYNALKKKMTTTY